MVMDTTLNDALEDGYALFRLTSKDGEFIKVAKYDKEHKRFWWFNEPGGKYKYGIMPLNKVAAVKITRGKYAGMEFNLDD